MRCLLCKNVFRVKTTWRNLFFENNYYLCDDCSNKYKVSYTYVRFPFDNILAHVFSVFDHYSEENPDAFILEKSILFSYIRSKFCLNKSIFLYYNSFDEMLENESIINELKNFNANIIIMLTYYTNF